MKTEKPDSPVIKEKLNILVVDDDVDILALVKQELKSSCEVFTAENIAQAMVIVKNNDIVITICDERLNGESGSELLTLIKDQYPDIVRILISGYTDTGAIMNAINKANVFKFIVKPWGKQLNSIIEEAYQYYQEKKRNQYKDSLTSLKSENTIVDTLHAELKRQYRYKTDLSVAMVSISNPKMDSALHAFLVDRFLLKKIADILAEELRDSDTAGRLRDNNFLILLTETGVKGSQIFVDRLLKKIEQFETTTNRGLLPYKIETSHYTLKEGEKTDEQDLLTRLYEELH